MTKQNLSGQVAVLTGAGGGIGRAAAEKLAQEKMKIVLDAVPPLIMPIIILGGVLSGIVEPVGAMLTILAAGYIVPALPYLLSFAAGAMIYVIVEELIPEMSQGQHSNVGTVFFAVGFSVMMVLDVALG